MNIIFIYITLKFDPVQFFICLWIMFALFFIIETQDSGVKLK